MSFTGIFKLIEIQDRHLRLDLFQSHRCRFEKLLKELKDLLELILAENKHVVTTAEAIDVVIEKKQRLFDRVEVSFFKDRAKKCRSAKLFFRRVCAKEIYRFPLLRLSNDYIKS